MGYYAIPPGFLIVCVTSCTRLHPTWISTEKCCKVGCSFVRYRPVLVFWMCLSKRSPCDRIGWKHEQSSNDTVCDTGVLFQPFSESFFYCAEFAGYFLRIAVWCQVLVWSSMKLVLSFAGTFLFRHVANSEVWTCFCHMLISCINSKVLRHLAT